MSYSTAAHGHARWKPAAEKADSSERLALRAAFAMGDAVHLQRTALGWSEEDLADRMGATAEEIEDIELGAVPVTGDLLFRLADAFEAEARFIPRPCLP